MAAFCGWSECRRDINGGKKMSGVAGEGGAERSLTQEWGF